MRLIAPLALALLGLLPVIVLLYFLKLKRREEAISSTYLWRRAIQDLRVNSPFQRLRRNLLLWLQLLLLTLLILGLARPAMNLAQKEGKRYIVMVDTSASMSARDGDPDRMAAARRETLRLIGDLGGNDEMMLIAFDAEPRVMAPFTSIRSRLREAARELTARETATDFVRAVELVKAFAADVGRARLFLISDGAFDASGLKDAPDIEFTYVKVGARGRNLGITALDARRSLENWDQPQVFARVGNFSDEEAEARLDLYLNGSLFDARALRIPPGQNGAAVFSSPALNEGLVKVVLDADDDLAVDNTAWLVLKEPKRVRTLVVTDGNYFLELAAQKDPMCSPVFKTPAAYEADARSGAAVMTDYDLAIFDRYAPPALPAGAHLFLGALPPLPGFASDGEAKDPAVVDWAAAHPVNQYLNYSYLFIESALKMRGPDDAAALVEGDAGPLVLGWTSPQHRVIVVGFDLFASRWPLRVSFPVFLANAIRYLGGIQTSGSEAMVRPGGAIVFSVPPDVERVQVSPPGATARYLPVPSGRVVYGDTWRCGAYGFQVRADEAKTYAVNLMDSRESDTTPADEVPWRGTAARGAEKALKENREFWPWFALAALAVLMLEWYIYNRRVYV